MDAQNRQSGLQNQYAGYFQNCQDNAAQTLPWSCASSLTLRLHMFHQIEI